MEKNYYQIDEVARLADITKRTIRYYEDMGLVKPARTESSYRLYTKEMVEEIIEIKNLRSKLGMNLEQVSRFVGLKKTIQAILEGRITDDKSIYDAAGMIRELIAFIEEKEKLLTKIKTNSSHYLERFDEILKQRENGQNE